MLTPISGDPDLFMSTVDQKPDRTHHEKASFGLTEDVITVENAAAKKYYLGVEGKHCSEAEWRGIEQRS